MIYTCNECQEQLCDHCDPAVECLLCQSLICENCENQSTYSDYEHRVICKSCFAELKPESQKHYELNRTTSSELFTPVTKTPIKTNLQ